jgi:hypothetical protein
VANPPLWRCGSPTLSHAPVPGFYGSTFGTRMLSQIASAHALGLGVTMEILKQVGTIDPQGGYTQRFTWNRVRCRSPTCRA